MFGIEPDRASELTAFLDQQAQSLTADAAIAKFRKQRDVDQEQLIGSTGDQLAAERLPAQLENRVPGAREVERVVVLLSVELHATKGIALFQRESCAIKFFGPRTGVQTRKEFVIVRTRRSDLIVGYRGQGSQIRLARIRAMLSVQMCEFRQLVFTRPDLREALRDCVGDQEFVIATIKIAGELGIELSADDVRLALNTGQREWIERWI